MNYKLQLDSVGNIASIVKGDGWVIPIDEANTDYQAYLKWLSEGNTPLQADE